MCKPGSTSVAADPREQLNENTAFLDGSMIYGSDEETSGRLRGHSRGLLQTNTKFSVGNLPTRSQCAFSSPPEMASDLIAGDIRVTEQPTLASIHTLFLNEHNRVAAGIEQFLKKSPNFLKMSSSEQDEFLYQVGKPMSSYVPVSPSECEAPRRSRAAADHLQVASLPHWSTLLCRGWLPVVLGAKAMGDLAQTTTKYDSAIDPSITNEFATVAFR